MNPSGALNAQYVISAARELFIETKQNIFRALAGVEL